MKDGMKPYRFKCWCCRAIVERVTYVSTVYCDRCLKPNVPHDH